MFNIKFSQPVMMGYLHYPWLEARFEHNLQEGFEIPESIDFRRSLMMVQQLHTTDAAPHKHQCNLSYVILN